MSTANGATLTSSRPAPPSPAVSRRASGFSRASSRPASRPASGMQHSRPISDTTRLASSPTTTATAPPPPPPPPASVFIHIRDYGFAQSDPRFTGHGPNVPRANRPAVLARRLASTSTGTSSSTSIASTLSSNARDDDDDDDYEDEDEDGERIQNMWQDMAEEGTNAWRGFKWGGFGRAWGTSTSARASTAGFPSRSDLDLNFGGEDGSGEEDMDVDVDSDMQVETDEFSDEEGHRENGIALCPGLYRALYAFEPEGMAEMRLDEDQLVRVVGRGGGVGWAVVVKDGLKDTGVHALVPESYLELVRFDGEDDDPEC